MRPKEFGLGKMRSRKKTNSMLQAERQIHILEISRKDLTILGSHLSELLGVSEMKDTAAELVLLPGTYDPATQALAGPLTMEMIRRVNANKVFLGADSLSLNAGLATTNLEIAVVERSMIRHTRGKAIAIADYSKSGRVAEISITPLKYINMLVTSRKIPDDFQREFELMGGQVVIA